MTEWDCLLIDSSGKFNWGIEKTREKAVNSPMPALEDMLCLPQSTPHKPKSNHQNLPVSFIVNVLTS